MRGLIWMYLFILITTPVIAITETASLATEKCVVNSGDIQTWVLNISSGAATIDAGSVQIEFDLYHSWKNDITITLQSPLGTTRIIKTGAVGGDNDYGLADGSNYGTPAKYTIKDGIGGGDLDPVSDSPPGSYDPVDAFSAFDGEVANGNWILTLSDGVNSDDGCIQNVALTMDVTYPCSAPTSAPSNPSAATYVNGTEASVTYDATGITNGDEVLVICRETGTAAIAPSDANSYSGFSTSFTGALKTTGAGNVVIYQGTNLNATKSATNLTCTTNYTFDVYSRNSADCYYTASKGTITYTDWRLCSIVYSQASTSSVSQSTPDLDNEILKIYATVGGSGASPLTMNTIAVTSLNTTDTDVPASGVRVRYNTSDNFGAASDIGFNTSFSAGVATLGTLAQDLAAGNNYFWVHYDLDAAATIGNVLDGKFAANSINIESVTYPSSEQSPAGSRSIVGNLNGFVIAGNIVNNGTWEQYSDNAMTLAPAEYTKVTGTTKTITGSGIYTNVWMQSEGSMKFDGTITSGSFSRTNVTNSFEVETAKTFITGNFSNSGTSTLNGTATLQVYGEFSNSNTLTSSNGSIIEFTGTSGQNVTTDGGGVGTQLEDVIFNNTHADGVTLIDPMTINTTGAVTFTDGIVTTTSASLLIFEDAATTSVGSDASHVVGPCRKFGNDANFIFPVGSNGLSRPIGISGNVNAAQSFTATSFDGSPVNPTVLDPAINNISTIHYWDLNQTIAGTDDAVVELFWTNAGAEGIDDCTDLTVAHYYNPGGGLKWYEEASTSDIGSSCAGAGSGSIKTDAVVTEYSFLTFASSGVGPNPLPVKLISFTGEKIGAANKLYWTTATEINADYFDIERSTDAIEFVKITSLAAAGNSNQLLNYTYTDSNPFIVSYYRLKQVDFDGSFVYSNILLIDRDLAGLNNTAADEMLIYPNPNTASNVNLQFYLSENKEVEIRVINVLGKVVRNLSVSISNNQVEELYVGNLAKGSYQVVSQFSNGITIAKVLIIK